MLKIWCLVCRPQSCIGLNKQLNQWSLACFDVRLHIQRTWDIAEGNSGHLTLPSFLRSRGPSFSSLALNSRVISSLVFFNSEEKAAFIFLAFFLDDGKLLSDFWAGVLMFLSEPDHMGTLQWPCNGLRPLAKVHPDRHIWQVGRLGPLQRGKVQPKQYPVCSFSYHDDWRSRSGLLCPLKWSSTIWVATFWLHHLKGWSIGMLPSPVAPL